MEAPLVGELEAVIPARALQELAKIVADADALEVLRVSRRANQVVFEAGDVVLSSRLIDGQFPNYKQLLPDSFEHELTLATDEFTDVVRRVSLMAQKNAPLRLSFNDGRVTVSARTVDVGEASQSVEIPFAGRTVRDRLQPGLPARRPGARRRGPRAAADQPAATRDARVRQRRRLPVPHHADPPGRVSDRARVRQRRRDDHRHLPDDHQRRCHGGTVTLMFAAASVIMWRYDTDAVAVGLDGSGTLARLHHLPGDPDAAGAHVNHGPDGRASDRDSPRVQATREHARTVTAPRPREEQPSMTYDD